MVETTAKRVRVGDRDRQIFRDHVQAFGLTTYEILRQLYWPTGKLHAAKSWVRRMKEGGYIDGAALIPPARYFYPTEKGTMAFHLRSVRSMRSPAVLADAYAVLLFCCLADPPLRKLTAASLAEKLPELAASSLDAEHYYLDEADSKRRIGFIYVDMRQKPEQIWRRVQDRIAKRMSVAPWRELIRSERFSVSIVTPHVDAARRIQEERVKLHSAIKIDIAVRDYGDVIPTRGRHAPQR